MRRAVAGAVAGLCLAGCLRGPSHAWADDDPGSDGLVASTACPADIGWVEISPPAGQIVPPGRVPSLPLSLRGAEGRQASAGEHGGARRGLPEEGGAQTSVALRVFTAERPTTLRDALDHDHRAALANTVGLVSLSARTVVSDEADDYQGRPSWFVRVRSEIPSYADGLCSATEYSVREVLVEHGGKTYLAQVQGVYSWKLAQAEHDESDPDPGSADAVADRVANGLDIEHAR